MIFTTTLHQREIEDTAGRQTAAALRRRERRPNQPAADHQVTLAVVTPPQERTAVWQVVLQLLLLGAE